MTKANILFDRNDGLASLVQFIWNLKGRLEESMVAIEKLKESHKRNKRTYCYSAEASISLIDIVYRQFMKLTQKKHSTEISKGGYPTIEKNNFNKAYTYVQSIMIHDWRGSDHSRMYSNCILPTNYISKVFIKAKINTVLNGKKLVIERKCKNNDKSVKTRFQNVMGHIVEGYDVDSGIRAVRRLKG
ncbi:MAG: hypothetical protein EXX96DRAFT_539734 [Benjaminiella poitrasii]|nr:MAG: hypothetical protein EXX96DRAFT_539734 [Benjaminiella poitrasii]